MSNEKRILMKSTVAERTFRLVLLLFDPFRKYFQMIDSFERTEKIVSNFFVFSFHFFSGQQGKDDNGGGGDGESVTSPFCHFYVTKTKTSSLFAVDAKTNKEFSYEKKKGKKENEMCNVCVKGVCIQRSMISVSGRFLFCLISITNNGLDAA